MEGGIRLLLQLDQQAIETNRTQHKARVPADPRPKIPHVASRTRTPAPGEIRGANLSPAKKKITGSIRVTPFQVLLLQNLFFFSTFFFLPI